MRVFLKYNAAQIIMAAAGCSGLVGLVRLGGVKWPSLLNYLTSTALFGILVIFIEVNINLIKRQGPLAVRLRDFVYQRCVSP